MTLLISVFAAVICTLLWYKKAPDNGMRLDIPCYIFWGASLMWLVDAIFEYSEKKTAYFTPSLREMISDTFLGFAVIALGLAIWVVILLVKDPKGVIKKSLLKK